MKKIITRIFTAVMLAAVCGLASCKKLSSFDYPPSEGTPYQIISDDVTYASFKIAVDRAGLQDMFNGDTEYTFFFPTTTALTASGYSTAYLQGMPSADAAALVKNHVVAGKVDVKTVTAPLTALSGKPIPIQTQGGTFFADGSDITRANIAASKSYINVVNNAFTLHNTLLDAVTNYQHATANNKIDMTLAAIARASTGSVNFNNLLSGTDGYTLFAPNNSAWIAYGYAAVANINTAPVETLVGILKYHLIPGAKLTTAFDSAGVASYAGTNIYFNRYLNFRTTEFYADGVMFGNGGSNIVAKNGVMHVIPWVIRAPVTKNTLDQIQGDATLSVFYAALIKASGVDPLFNFQTMLSGPRAYTVFAINNTGMAAAGYANVAAVNAAPADELAKIIKLHIVPRRVQWVTVGVGSVNSLLVTKSSTGVTSQNPLTFSAFTVVANGAGTFSVKAASNPTPFTVLSPNTTTTNGMLNIVGGVFIP